MISNDPKLKQIAQEVERSERTLKLLNDKLEAVEESYIRKIAEKTQELEKQQENEKRTIQRDIEREEKRKSQLLADHTRRSTEIEKMNADQSKAA